MMVIVYIVDYFFVTYVIYLRANIIFSSN